MLKRMRLGLSAAAAYTMIAAPHPAAAEVMQAPNSVVTMNLPEGFGPSGRFSGFEFIATGASFIIMELPADAYAGLDAGLSAEALNKRGIALVEKRQLARSDEHIFVHGRQKAAGLTFEKLFLVFKAGNKTHLVSGNVPETAVADGRLPLKTIEAALVSAAVTDAKPVKPLFELTELGRFKDAGTLLGTTRSYTVSGKLLTGEAGKDQDALLIVSPAIDKRRIGDVKAFSLSALGQTQSIPKFSVTSEGPITIAGLSGHEFAAAAVEKTEHGFSDFYQVVLVEPDGGYVRILGMAKGADSQTYMQEYKAMARSFVLKP